MAGNNIKQSVSVDLEGNLPQRSKQYEKALQRMGQRGERYLSNTARMASVAGRGLNQLGNRYTGLISGATVAYAVKQVGDLSERYTRLGINAGLGADKVDQLKQQVFDVSQAPDIRVDPAQMLGAIEDIVEKTGDLEFAQNNIRNIGLAIQATGAAGQDVGALLAEFQKQGITAPGEVLKTIDAMNEQGKEGAFTLKDLANLGPRVVSAYNAAGRQGTQAMKEMGAALQVVRMGTGSSEQAATAFEAVMRTMADPKKIKQLKDLGGISVFDPDKLKEGKQQLRPINELMVEIVKAAGGKQTNLAQVFDAEALRAFNTAAAEYQRTGSVESLQKFMEVSGDGTTTINDSARAAREFNASITYLKTSWDQFANDNLAEPINDLADTLNSLDPDQVQRYFRYAKNGVIALGGAIVAGKLISGVNALRSLSGGGRGARGGFGGGKGRGGLGGALGSMKPVPVYVVNKMPGMGGKGGKFNHINRSGRNRIPKGSMMGKAGKAIPVAAAGYAGWEAGSYIQRNYISGTSTGDAIGEGLNRIAAFFGNEESKRAIAMNERMEREREQRIRNEIHLRIDSDGAVRTQSMTAGDGTDIDIDAGPTMGMMP